jgi:hypothetical protein
LILPGEVSFRSTRPTLPPPAGELLQAIGQVLGPGHGRAVDEDRDARMPPLERRLNLDAHKVMGILETTLVPSVGAGGPTRADHCDEGVALTDALRQDVNEIFSKFDVVDVEKKAFASQSSHEAVINAPREAARIVSLMKTPPNTSMPSPLAQN